MTPKEKAFYLFDRYYTKSDLLVEDLSKIQAKECALIAVDEILKINSPTLVVFKNGDNAEAMTHEHYWKQVKTEIEQL